MKHWSVYRWALKLLPAHGEVNASGLPEAQTQAARAILRRHRCAGAALCLFDETGVTGGLSYGISHPEGTPVTESTVFRAASVSKFVTALGAMRLRELGIIDLDRDVGAYLPAGLMDAWQPGRSVTLRALLTHTAGVRDSEFYNEGIARGVPLSAILHDGHFDGRPGVWVYSNLGAGIAGVVMEAAAGVDFETLMQETVFHPLGAPATYYPQKAQGDLADAWRVLPPRKKALYDAAARRARPLPPGEVDAERHYSLAHGALCVTAAALARLGMAGMTPGFLSRESLEAMRREAAPFGSRARNLSQGIGTFILREPKIASRPLYGHQGMAYGAVNGLFFDPETKKGLALLTSGASEARCGVLADLNFDLLRLFLGDRHG